MTSQNRQQIIKIHILPIISRSKRNQTKKLLNSWSVYKCNRNIVLKKIYRACGGEVSPRPFYKKVELSISLD